jgi:O-antigen/teichoic acid export membrane protein
MKLKIFGKNAVIYGIGNVGLRTSALLLIPLYTHTLSIEDYGFLSTLLLTAQLMIIFMSLGMRTVIMRFGKDFELSGSLAGLIGNTMTLNILGGMMVAAITLFFMRPFFANILHTSNVDRYLYLTCAVAFLQSTALHIMSYYRIKEQPMKFTGVGLFSAVLLFLSSLVFLLVCQLGVIGALLAGIFSYGLISLFLVWDVVVRRTGFHLSLNSMLKFARFGFPLIFSMLGQFLMASSGAFFISYYHGLDSVAVYSLGSKLAMVVGIVLTLPFQLAYQPFVFNNLNKPYIREKMSRLLTYYFVAVLCLTFFIVLSSKIVLPIIAPPEYFDAFFILLLLLPAMTLNGMIVFGETLLVVSKKTSMLGVIIGFSGLINLVLNNSFVPHFGLLGAIISANLSFLAASVTITLCGLKSFPVPLEWRRITAVLMVFMGVLACSYFFKDMHVVGFYSGLLGLATFLFYVSLNCGFFDFEEKIYIKSFLLKEIIK